MTKQEICRAISEKMEPNAHSRTDSDFEWWGQSWSAGKRTLFPLDYFESEDASAKLLEAMPEPELWLESRKDEKFRLWACWADLDGKPEDAYAHHADRKTAIVLAAMGWLGIEGEISA